MDSNPAEILAMVTRLMESDFIPENNCPQCAARHEQATSREYKILKRRGCPHQTSADAYENTWRDLISEIKPTSAE